MDGGARNCEVSLVCRSDILKTGATVYVGVERLLFQLLLQQREGRPNPSVLLRARCMDGDGGDVVLMLDLPDKIGAHRIIHLLNIVYFIVIDHFSTHLLRRLKKDANSSGRAQQELLTFEFAGGCLDLHDHLLIE